MGEPIKNNINKTPNYIVDFNKYNYVKVNNYFFLYDFEDPITHLVLIHPKILLAATQVAIALRDKISIIAGYMNERYSDMESLEDFEAHNTGRAVDFTPDNTDKVTLMAVCEASGFNVVKEYEHYIHAEICFTKEGVKL